MNLWKSFTVWIAGLCLTTAAACAAPPAGGQTTAPAANPPAAAAPAASSDASNIADAYRLDSGDQIKITVFNEPNLSGNFQVDGTVMISMSLIGEVQAKNKTVRQLQRDIETKLRDGYLRNPQVSAEVVTFRPFYILGEVNEPGQYPYTDGLTVLNAIASAGDFTYRADKRRVMIKSVDSPEERSVVLTPTTPVKPGDTIRVRERFF
jgi:polysaccharide biosynthesis/export protein VpsN